MDKRKIIMQLVQPGLNGLMDGSVSTLAPIFTTALITHSTLATLLVGLSTATGAGISMAFAEALSDDGIVSQRGSPLKRGLTTGLMTTVGGSLHCLPFLISNYYLAIFICIQVVLAELCVISIVRWMYFEISLWRSIFEVFGSGVLVVTLAWLFGSG